MTQFFQHSKIRTHTDVSVCVLECECARRLFTPKRKRQTDTTLAKRRRRRAVWLFTYFLFVIFFVTFKNISGISGFYCRYGLYRVWCITFLTGDVNMMEPELRFLEVRCQCASFLTVSTEASDLEHVMEDGGDMWTSNPKLGIFKNEKTLNFHSWLQKWMKW